MERPRERVAGRDRRSRAQGILHHASDLHAANDTFECLIGRGLARDFFDSPHPDTGRGKTVADVVSTERTRAL